MSRSKSLLAAVALLFAGGLLGPVASDAGVTTPRTYTVEAGDTYRVIANKLGLSESALACANRTSANNCPNVTANPGLGRIIQLSPTVTPPTSTTLPPTTTTTTIPVTTTTAAPTTTTTTVPATTTTVPSNGNFPTAASAGLPAGTSLTTWTGAWRTSSATRPTQVIDGHVYKVFSNILFDTGNTGNYLYVDDPYVLFENDKFVTSGTVSNTSAMVQASSASLGLVVRTSDFDGGPFHNRGIQSDYGLSVYQSEFTRFGNAAIEMNNRGSTGSLIAQDNYMFEPQGWCCGAHVDGIQIGGGKNATIKNNTVLITPYNTGGDVSNSALGLWAELGNFSGTVIVDHNYLAGGGRIMYLEQKSPFAWQGPVSVTNNVFSNQFTQHGGIWGILYPTGLPAQLTWSGNTWQDGTPVSLAAAKVTY